MFEEISFRATPNPRRIPATCAELTARIATTNKAEHISAKLLPADLRKLCLNVNVVGITGYERTLYHYLQEFSPSLRIVPLLSAADGTGRSISYRLPVNFEEFGETRVPLQGLVLHGALTRNGDSLLILSATRLQGLPLLVGGFSDSDDPELTLRRLYTSAPFNKYEFAENLARFLPELELLRLHAQGRGCTGLLDPFNPAARMRAGMVKRLEFIENGLGAALRLFNDMTLGEQFEHIIERQSTVKAQLRHINISLGLDPTERKLAPIPPIALPPPPARSGRLSSDA